jgi:hypothetical protein
VNEKSLVVMLLPEKVRADPESSPPAKRGYTPVAMERVRNEMIPKELRRSRCPKECVKYRKERG